MGTYVNPGNAAFREALNSRIYIDKTKLTLYTNSILNTTKKVYASAVPAVSESPCTLIFFILRPNLDTAKFWRYNLIGDKIGGYCG